jgi:hypothetical protein
VATYREGALGELEEGEESLAVPSQPRCLETPPVRFRPIGIAPIPNSMVTIELPLSTVRIGVKTIKSLAERYDLENGRLHVNLVVTLAVR